MFLGRSKKKNSSLSFSFCLALLICIPFLLSYSVTATAQEVIQADDPTQSIWSLIRPRLRLRTFSELMVPSFQGNTDSVPKPDGSKYAPANLFNIVWTDYEIGQNLRLFYWQRFIVTLNSNSDFQALEYLPRDPRFGIRFLQVFDAPGLSTSYDLFLQPNVTANQISNRNFLEFGFRTSTSYTIPKSHLSLGLVQEYTMAYLGGEGPRSYGWAMPWFSYELSKTFSTQTAFSFPIQNLRKEADWLKFVWDAPGSAYVQNGIGVNVSQQVWVAFFINNYLFAPLSWNNTWASMWVSLTLL